MTGICERQIPVFKLSAQRNETETKQFRNSIETTLKLFHLVVLTVLQFTRAGATKIASFGERLKSHMGKSRLMHQDAETHHILHCGYAVSFCS